MKPVITSLIIIIIIISARICDARILNVPEDYQTIQAGIDSSSEGDTVLVAEGHYMENLRFSNHYLTISSQYLNNQSFESVAATIIDGNDRSSVLSVAESSSGKLIGLTITNGTAQRGGGIYFSRNCEFDLDHIVLTDNLANIAGGGIAAASGNVIRINHSIIDNNSSNSFGGGIFLGGADAGNLTISNTQFMGNSSASDGAAIYSEFIVSSVITKCLISDNSSVIGVAVVQLHSRSALIDNCTIVNNVGRYAGVYVDPQNRQSRIRNCILGNSTRYELWVGGEGGGACELLYSCIDTTGEEFYVRDGNWITGNENIFLDPLFLDPDNGDYRLTADSPCIDAGDPDSPSDPDSTRADIGAYYYQLQDIEIQPLELLFPPVAWGMLDSLPLEIMNTGQGLLIIEAIERLNQSCVFIREQDLPIELESDSTITIMVYIMPDSTVGSIESWFNFVSNDFDEPEVTIHAQGEWPSIVSNPQLSAFSFQLYPTYPNPFNSSTTIRFSTGPINREATLRVYGLDGRLVEELETGKWKMENGNVRSVTWNAEGLPGGVYVIRLEAGKDVKTMKAILLR